MADSMKSKRGQAAQPNYGIDAPGAVRSFVVIAVLELGIGAAVFGWRGDEGDWVRYIIIPCVVMGAAFGLAALVMLWGSKFGKLGLRDRLIRGMAWRGDEAVLDVGCGHGLLLIGAAKRLRGAGKAVGLDLWQAEDQAGNSRQATWRNVELEGVAERVELVDGDARKLPFGDGRFDVIVSSWALHNIPEESGRETAVREMVRVLKPGGRLVIVDIRHTGEYAAVLRECGMAEVKRSGPSFLFVIPSYTLRAVKPAR